MDLFQNFVWYIVGFYVLFFLTSILYYKSLIEKKGKKYLVIPFFIIVALSILFTVLFGALCNSEGCMGIGYFFIGVPLFIGTLLGIIFLNWVIFRIFKITDKKKLKICWFAFFIVCSMPIVLFGFSPGDRNRIEETALLTGNIKKCDDILISFSFADNRRVRESCKLQVAKVINNFEICKTFSKSERTRSACVSWAVARTGEKRWCDLLQGSEKSHCEQILQTTLWMKENYCTDESYTSCLSQICKKVFLNSKYQFSVDSLINTCLHTLGTPKNQNSQGYKIKDL